VSEQLERGAEITKLARLLDVPTDELSYLAEVPSAALAAFREQVADRLFGGDAERLKRVAAASKLLPLPLAVKLAQLAFGPMLCAATAGLLEPPRAAKISGKMPVPFLADVATMMDPRRAAAVIAAVPTPVVVAVGRELISREEYVMMGRFVGLLSQPTLRAAVPAIESDEALLHTAFVLEDKDRLDDLLAVARDRVVNLIHTAHAHDMWGEALDLISHLDLANRAELADIAAAQDDELLDSLIRAVHEMGNWDDMLPVIAAMSPDSLRRFAELPVVVEDDVLRAVINAAAEHDLWDAVLPLAAIIPESVKPRLASSIGDLGREQLLAALEAAARSDHVETLVDIALRQDAAGRERMLTMIAETDRLEEFAKLLTADTPEVVWDALVEVKEEMPDSVRRIVHDRATDLRRDDVVETLDRADPPSAPTRPRPRPGPGPKD
jgi:hypothetical protein